MARLYFKQIINLKMLILSMFRIETIRQASSCHTKCDGGNILHVATLCRATQLILFIVDLQRYFSHISSACKRRFDPGLLQSVGWDYKPRSRLHTTLAVGGTLNPNQPTNQHFQRDGYDVGY